MTKKGKKGKKRRQKTGERSHDGYFKLHPGKTGINIEI